MQHFVKNTLFISLLVSAAVPAVMQAAQMEDEVGIQIQNKSISCFKPQTDWVVKGKPVFCRRFDELMQKPEIEYQKNLTIPSLMSGKSLVEIDTTGHVFINQKELGQESLTIKDKSGKVLFAHNMMNDSSDETDQKLIKQLKIGEKVTIFFNKDNDLKVDVVKGKTTRLAETSLKELEEQRKIKRRCLERVDANRLNILPLTIAIRENNIGYAEKLIELGADPFKSDKNSQSLLEVAMQINKKLAFSLLKKWVSIDRIADDNEQKIAKRKAIIEKCSDLKDEIQQMFIDEIAEDPSSFIKIRNAIQLGADVNEQFTYYYNYKKMTALGVVAGKNEVKIARLLIAKGAHINGNLNNTALENQQLPKTAPLIEAVEYGQTAMARFLIKNGASVNILTEEGRPLIHAIEKIIEIKNELDDVLGDNENNRLEGFLDSYTKIAHLLLGNGAKVSLSDQQGRTALEFAQKCDDDGIIELVGNKRYEEVHAAIVTVGHVPDDGQSRIVADLIVTYTFWSTTDEESN